MELNKGIMPKCWIVSDVSRVWHRPDDATENDGFHLCGINSLHPFDTVPAAIQGAIDLLETLRSFGEINARDLQRCMDDLKDFGEHPAPEQQPLSMWLNDNRSVCINPIISLLP